MTREEAWDKYHELKERREQVKFQMDVLKDEEEELDKAIKELYTDMKLHKE